MPGTLLEVNVSSTIRSRIERSLAYLPGGGAAPPAAATDMPTLTVFDEAADEVLRMLYSDTFQRYVVHRRSSAHHAPSRGSDGQSSLSDSPGVRKSSHHFSRHKAAAASASHDIAEDDPTEMLANMSSSEVFFFLAMAAEQEEERQRFRRVSETAEDSDTDQKRNKGNRLPALMRGLGITTGPTDEASSPTTSPAPTPVAPKKPIFLGNLWRKKGAAASASDDSPRSFSATPPPHTPQSPYFEAPRKSMSPSDLGGHSPLVTARSLTEDGADDSLQN
ncbi:hypothetical protein HK405_000605 [Cladochytrium tenue]|nr:hypothetical protein HK405_000605 [Cladochytrium tenue]